MTTENRAQIATLLTYLESISVSLRQFMNAQIASEHLQSSTEIISSQIEAMNLLVLTMRGLATELGDGGGNDYPY